MRAGKCAGTQFDAACVAATPLTTTSGKRSQNRRGHQLLARFSARHAPSPYIVVTATHLATVVPTLRPQAAGAPALSSSPRLGATQEAPLDLTLVRARGRRLVGGNGLLWSSLSVAGVAGPRGGAGPGRVAGGQNCGGPPARRRRRRRPAATATEGVMTSRATPGQAAPGGRRRRRRWWAPTPRGCFGRWALFRNAQQGPTANNSPRPPPAPPRALAGRHGEQ
jgi:hypothetical protein